MKEFLRFCIVGVITFLIDYSFLFCFTEFIGINYLIASACAFIVAVLCNYIFCLKFVFYNSKDSFKAKFLFLITSIVGFLLNQICMWLFVELLIIHYLVAKIIVTAIVMLWNFFTKKIALK